MATSTQSITSFSFYSGLDQSGNSHSNYFIYTNSVVVPSSTITAVSLNLMFYGLSSTGTTLTSVNVTSGYYTVGSSGGNGNELGNPINVSYLNHNLGKTICLQFLTSQTITNDYSAYSVSGSITFTTSDVTYTFITIPSSATVTMNSTTTKSLTVASGTTINWTASASGYTTRTGKVAPTSDTTKYLVLKKSNAQIALGSTECTNIKLGTTDVIGVCLGSTPIWTPSSKYTALAAGTTGSIALSLNGTSYYSCTGSIIVAGLPTSATITSTSTTSNSVTISGSTLKYVLYSTSKNSKISATITYYMEV